VNLPINLLRFDKSSQLILSHRKWIGIDENWVKAKKMIISAMPAEHVKLTSFFGSSIKAGAGQ
jgi:hypothetical protein